ncbi:MAG TPA: polyprenyl diphosphate synthase, partial [Acetobacteraceae bacterium]|nr:polyprenyl diphosphate synthase [Acetobacteraceae bacterium]
MPTRFRAAATAPTAGPPPAHVAIIMDGNGRWAAGRHLPRVAGHREGAKAVRRSIEAAIHQGVGWLTLYAFSSENWRRPADEISDLTGLLRYYIKAELAELTANGVRVRVIGDRARFDADIQAQLAAAEAATSSNTRLNLTVALSYGARAEIAAAARALAEAARGGRLDPAAIDEAAIAPYLATAGMPDPDVVIRTSGEQRLSNFLLWQAAYAELVFLDVLWPDFA